ncbi:MAG: iron-containing alcohol dehydrogenase [Candidatus Latescibacterota bacterium]
MEFAFSHTPNIRFGAGTLSEIPEIVRGFGKTVLLVTGGRSFVQSKQFARLIDAFREWNIAWRSVAVSGEPSPDMVDMVTGEYRGQGIDAVFAVGGGSVIDAGKAISAMLPQEGSVFDYLEGVGTGKKHDGRKVPFIAAPTTAGTGSEATKNAVLSRIGPGGFKKSIRHENFIPDYAVVDPELAISCPADITAACGMDAFTQLLESYVSAQSSPMTDALALSGMEQMKDALVPAATKRTQSIGVRADMAYGALMSGITLANAGLGVVHGLASTIGGRYPISHGVICGVLLEPATRVTIRRLQESGPKGEQFLAKYSRVGHLLAGETGEGIGRGCDLLLERLSSWREILRLPLLSDYGITRGDREAIAATAGNGNNPVMLQPDEIAEIVELVIH